MTEVERLQIELCAMSPAAQLRAVADILDGAIPAGTRPAMREIAYQIVEEIGMDLAAEILRAGGEL